MRKRIVVFGWFFQGNVGDDAFRETFLSLWGDKCSLTFVNEIPENVNDYDALWIGGGSFLDQPIRGLSSVKITIAFIGVGIHSIHPLNAPAIMKARLIVSRNDLDFKPACEHHKAADMVFGWKDLARFTGKTSTSGKVIILGNDFLIPRRDSPAWMDRSFNWFIHEFPEVCNRLIAEGRKIDFYPMCTGEWDDRYFNFCVASRIEKRGEVSIDLEGTMPIPFATALSQASLVISLRLHGSIFSTIVGQKFVGINSHDKMKSFADDLGTANFLNYYGFRADEFNLKLQSMDGLEDKLIAFTLRERERWVYLSGVVAERFSL